MGRSIITLAFLLMFARIGVAGDIVSNTGKYDLDFTIDCKGVDHAATDNPVSFTVKEVRNGNTHTIRSQTQAFTESKCKNTLTGYYGEGVMGWTSESSNLNYLRIFVEASGPNALWIDRAKLVAYQTPVVGAGGVAVGVNVVQTIASKKEWGADGGKGWCISTQSTDSFGSEKQDGSCHRCIMFKAADEKAYACD